MDKEIIKSIKGFQVGGFRYSVEFKDNIEIEGAIGSCNYITNTISIRKEFNGEAVSSDNMLVTMLHELTHSILNVMGQEELNQQEEFVDLFAHQLAQVLKTLEFHGDCDKLN